MFKVQGHEKVTRKWRFAKISINHKVFTVIEEQEPKGTDLKANCDGNQMAVPKSDKKCCYKRVT